MNGLLMIICLLITSIVGIIIGHVMCKKSIFVRNSVGSLRIDSSDPDDGPYLFLELSTDPSYISKQDYIVLKVNTKNLISHQ